MAAIPHVAIVGAGPGGLTLARLLHGRGIASTLFERDAHALLRPQGGSLDLHAESGLLALERAGLTSEFERFARPEDQGTRVFDVRGQLMFEDAGEDERPEIDRSELRALLLQSVPPQSVQWGQALHRVERRADGRFDLLLVHAHKPLSAGPFDLVVGADGCWSRVRPGVSPQEPVYTGVTFVEFGIDDVDRQHPEIAAMVGRGKMSVTAQGRGLIAQRNGNGHVRVYAIFKVPQDWAGTALDATSADTLRASVLAQFDGWAHGIRALFEASNDQVAVRPLHAMPVGFRWDARPGLTLIGDAAHVMSPFGGEGVNNAMLDALTLADAVSDALQRDGDWREAVRLHELEMFDRVLPSATHAARAVSGDFDEARALRHIAMMKARRGM